MTIIHVSDPVWEIGKIYSVDIAILGDPGLVMAQLSDRLQTRVSADKLENRDDQSNYVASSPEEEDRERRIPGFTCIGHTTFVEAMYNAASNARIIVEAPTSIGTLRNHWNFELGQYFANRWRIRYSLPTAIGYSLSMILAL